MNGVRPIATVLLVDDERNVTDGLLALLRPEPYEIICAHSAGEALGVLARYRVDVVVSDEQMPGMTGTELLRRVAREFPGTARLLLTGRATLATAVRAINEGRICRLLSKPCGREELTAAIADAVNAAFTAMAAERLLAVARNERTARDPAAGASTTPLPEIGAATSRRFGAISPRALQSLSARELEVLALVLDGQRVAQAAAALFISQHTVRNHLKAIFRKLNVHSQAELLARSRGMEPSD